MNKNIIVNCIKRINGATCCEVSNIGNKQLITPAYIPKIKKPIDFNIVCDNIYLENPPKAICLDIHTIDEIMRGRRENSRQMTLQMETVDKSYDKLIKEIPILIDPNTEAFYYQIPWKKSNVKNEIINKVKMSDELIEILSNITISNYNDSWKKISGDLLISYIDYMGRYQIEKNADIIIPPVPLITGSSMTLQLMRDINIQTRKAFEEGTFAVPSMFIPLQYSLFTGGNDNNNKAIETILKFIQQNIMFYRCLIIKLIWYGNIKNNKSARRSFGNFLSRINQIKMMTNDTITTILLDAGPEGLYTLVNGMDAFIEPIGGRIGVTRGKREDDDNLENIRHGNYLHPTEGYISFNQLLNILEKTNGVLPCSCQACEKYHGLLTKDVSTLDWNLSRRAHAINLRRRDVDILHEEILKGTAEDIIFKIDRSEDRNYIDLLPRNSESID